MTMVTTPRIETGRKTVYSSGGVVVSISPLAVSAGIRELALGGNAFDAAVAVAAVEAVTVPPSCGLGGEPFVIMYDAKSGLVHGLNGSGKAPLAASRDFFVERGHRFMPLEGPLAAAIPGEALAWDQIAERFGTRPLSKLLEPAIEYADQGFAISEELARGFEILNPKLARFPESRDIFTRDGRLFLPGDTLVQRDLAGTLKQIASGGAEAFYKGDIGIEMARAIQAAGGLYTAQEIADHENVWYEPPISTTYHGHTVYETAPPSQGLTLLEMLNILEGYDLAEMGFYTAESVHTMVEAKKLAFADRNKYAGDMDFVSVPVSELISKRFAARRRELISETAGRGEALEPLVSIPGDGNTSYFCVVDAEGNAVSFHPQSIDGIRLWLRGRKDRRAAEQPGRPRLQPCRRTPERYRGRKAHHAHPQRPHGDARRQAVPGWRDAGRGQPDRVERAGHHQCAGPRYERAGGSRGSQVDLDSRNRSPQHRRSICAGD